MAMSREKQFELMYQDMTQTLSHQKRARFDLARWLVTVQSAIAGFALINPSALQPWFAGLPLMAGLAALILDLGFARELYAHRKALAEIRRRVGGDFEGVFRDMVERYAGEKPVEFGSYHGLLGMGQVLIILLSTAASALIVYFSAQGLWAGA